MVLLVMFCVLTILPSKSLGISYQDVESVFMTADHFWDFEQSFILEDRKTTRRGVVHGQTSRSPSPANRGIFLDGQGNWVDLNIQLTSQSCLRDPSDCAGLTVAMLLRVDFNPNQNKTATSEVFGPYGVMEEVTSPGVRVTYEQPSSSMSIYIIGSAQQCHFQYVWPRNRWVFLVFTWSSVDQELKVFVDESEVNDKKYNCQNKPTSLAVQNKYALGFQTYPVAWYDMLGIWSRVVPPNDFPKMFKFMLDNGGKTTLNISLDLYGLAWNRIYHSSSSPEFEELQNYLINNITFADGAYGRTFFNNATLLSFQKSVVNTSEIVRAKLRLPFTALDKRTTIELQEILSSVRVGGQRAEVAECSSDDNFFCELPAEVRVSPTNIASALWVTWQTLPSILVPNGYFRRHIFTHNLTDTENGTTNKLETLENGRHAIFGLRPYTYYCVRMAAESFKASGFFTAPSCGRTIEWKPSTAPLILAAYNTSHLSIFVEWNRTLPQREWNGVPVGYQVKWDIGKENAGINDSFYNITGLKPYRVYTIKVSGRTVAGAGVKSSVKVRTAEWYPSNHPSNIEIFNTSQTSMMVTWSDIPLLDQNGIILKYELELFDADNDGRSVENVTLAPSTNQTEFHNLTIYNAYGVQIRGFTSVGRGPFNNWTLSIARTEESVPIIGPSNFSGYSLSTEGIQLQWSFDSHFRNVRGVLLGFRIFFDGADLDPDFEPSPEDVVGNDVDSMLFTDLWPFTTYNLSIAAFTKIGHGVLSEAILVRTDGKAPEKPPSPVTAYNTSSTSIRVTWDEVDKYFRHGVLLGYRVVLSDPLNTSSTVVNRTIPIQENTTLFIGLKKYTTYVFEVLAFNKYGDGDFETIDATTDEDVPSMPPTMLKARNTSSTSLLVDWQPLKHNFYVHGVLLGYLLSYHRVDGNGSKTHMKLCPLCLSLNIPGLDEYTEYNISVSAFNRKGPGAASQSVLCTTSEDVPAHIPVNIQGFNTSKNSIIVLWDAVPSDDQNGVILGYYLVCNKTSLASARSRRRRSVTFSSFSLTLPAEQKNHTLKGLDPYTLYSVSVAAYTKIGPGQWSPPIIIRTDEEEPQIPPTFVTAYNYSSTSINVTWLAIPPAMVAGILRFYVITYTELDVEGNNVSTNVTRVPVRHMSVLLKGLTKYTNYSITVKGVTIRAGVDSQPVFMKTNEDSPDQAPQYIKVVLTSYSSLNVSWSPIPTPFVNGILQGMMLFYKKSEDVMGNNVTVDLQPNTTSYHVTNLEPSTNYSFWMLGYTSVGYGLSSEVYLGETDEYVPSKAPVNVTALNFTSHESINVSWHSIPTGHIHGILRGYRVTYKQIRSMDQSWNKQQTDRQNLTVKHDVLSTVITQLDNYAVYEIEVLGFTIKGDGVASKPINAETCRCSKHLRTSWHVIDPYVTNNRSQLATTATDGLIPTILEPLVTSCCGICHNGHGQTDIDFLHDANGQEARKKNNTELLKYAAQDTDLMFPVNGFEGKTTHGINAYVGLVTSPGVAFITAKQIPANVLVTKMAGTILNSWTLIALMFSLVTLAGILTWVLDTRSNPEHFPRPFVRGAYEGCWLAFISVTTVGYGDRTPKSVCARILSIVNMLCGFVLISMITANLSSDLVVTSIMAQKRNLYKSKVGAITDSHEYRIGLKRNALVNTESEYHSYEELHQALASGEVHGILVDSYVATKHQELFTLPSGRAEIRQQLKYENIYGVVLGGRSNKLQKCFNDYLKNNKKEVYKIIGQTLSHMSNQGKSAAAVAEKEKTTNILDPSTQYFRTIFIYTSLLLLTAAMIGLAYEILLRRIKGCRNTVVPSSQRGFRQRVKCAQDMKQMIKDFYEDFASSHHELKAQHKQERRSLLISSYSTKSSRT